MMTRCFIFILIWATSCVSPKKPTFIRTENMRIQSIGLRQSVLKGNLVFHNPNRMRAVLQRSEIDVFINDERAGQTTLDTSITIPSRDTFSIPVMVSIDMKNFVRNAVVLLTREKVQVRLSGNATLKKSGRYFRIPIQYSGEQKLF
jgi:LEA14-like dessication related protein